MRLLIIGTLNGQIGAASQIAIKRGAKVQQVDTEDVALETLRAGHGADLIMADVSLDIVKLISSLEKEHISVPVVACGIANDTEAAVRAIRAGAKEYVPLPPDAELIAAVFEAVAEESQSIIYKDQRMVSLMQIASQVAPSEASILVTGASGTGKELVARHLHNKSKRKDGPFVAVNCAAIPENLLESELFGHEKGAFTGAVARRIGKFEEANGGTILLDEISEMDPRLQAKLLRAIQEREIDRLGGNKTVPVNVRIVATSNRNMEEEVATGKFREDLFFRLNVMSIKLPMLKERPADIPILAHHFVAKYTEINGLPERQMNSKAMELLKTHNWPGNVRELENTVHRAVLLASGDEIGAEAIMLTDGAVQKSNDILNYSEDGSAEIASMVGRTVADVERELIIDTLQHCLGNRTHAANILGISIRTLRNKLKTYGNKGFSVPQPGEAAPSTT